MEKIHMEIDLFSDPPTADEISAERAHLENLRLLIVQNDEYVVDLFHKLLIKAVVIVLILVCVSVLYFILPAGMFGMANGRTILLVTVSVMLVSSLAWIGWRTITEAKSIVPNRGYSIARMKQVKTQVAELDEIDVKLRLNVVNWSRSNGVLSEYAKKITRQRRQILAIEYIEIRKFLDKLAIANRVA